MVKPALILFVLVLKQLELVLLLEAKVIDDYQQDAQHAQQDLKPNVLFLIIDDFRPALGSYGEKVFTPNLDQLAAQSIRFTDARAQQAVCAPSRISFLTGRRPDSTLLWDFRSSYWRKAAGNYTTLPQHFKQNGYYTLSAGKVFHHGPCSNDTDDYPLSWSIPCFWPSTKMGKNVKMCPGEDGNLHYYTMCPVNVTESPQGTLPDIQSTDYAINALRSLAAARKGRKLQKGNSPSVINPLPHTPFFLAVGYHKPHLPFRYPEEFKSLYPLNSISMAPNPFYTKGLPPPAWEHWNDVKCGEDIPLPKGKPFYGPLPPKYHLLMRQAYFAAASYVDYEIGRLLSTLDKEGFANNTIICLTADHGWQLGEHQEWSKYSNYDSATRVPLMFYVPTVTGKKWRHKYRFSLIDPLNRDQQTKSRRSPVNTVSERHNAGYESSAIAELVDIFPTLSDLAGLRIPDVCPMDTFNTDFCAEGISLGPVIRNVTETLTDVKIVNWKNASFSQYPRPTFYPSHKTNTPHLSEITIMGYSMHTKHYRYVEWLPFNHTNFYVNWSQPFARELYTYENDPLEMSNVVNSSQHRGLVLELSKKLRNNWRYALPTTVNISTPLF